MDWKYQILLIVILFGCTESLDKGTLLSSTTPKISTPPKGSSISPSKNDTGNVVEYKRSVPQIALRAFYVVSVVSALVIVYFVVRGICARRNRGRIRRYGVLRETTNDNMEMRPLSELDDDDDDDMTLFDVNQQKKKTRR